MSRFGRSLARTSIAALLLVSACAPATGWRRDDARACAPGSPPILCLEAAPDRPVELRFSGLSILPGECARAPEKSRGGRLVAELVDREGHTESVRLHVRKNRVTFVSIDARGHAEVGDRDVCDREVPAPLADPSP